MSRNPYTENTQKYKIFEILKDLKWHCSECELPGSQPAKALQMMRQDGLEMERVGSNWEKRIYCDRCGRETPHRRFVSLDINSEPISRVAFTPRQRKQIVDYYHGVDEILGYAPTGRSIEIDHRIPEVRWTTSEEPLPKELTEIIIEERYMLLVREHNLLKSRSCERCNETDIRQPLLGINYFYAGTGLYDEELGCIGCGWYNPKIWRQALNMKVMGE